MAFTLVGEVVAEVRVLLQDTYPTAYRYDDASVYQALNEGLLESGRLRPDFWRRLVGVLSIPSYTPEFSTYPIDYPEIFIPALINYTVGRVQLRDAEGTTDQRAGTLITSFRQALLSVNI